MSINYGYFRHRFDATEDPKLQALVEKVGISGIAYYFILLEIYGKNYANIDEGGIVKIHKRVLASAWHRRTDLVAVTLGYMQTVGLLYADCTHNTYSLSIPNFSKYYGSYKKKATNKRKEKESKVKGKEATPRPSVSKDKPTISDVTEAVKYLNLQTSKNFNPNRPKTVSMLEGLFKSGHTLADVNRVIDSKISQWSDDKMSKFLRPDTLFSSKFEGYLNETPVNNAYDKFLVVLQEANDNVDK